MSSTTLPNLIPVKTACIYIPDRLSIAADTHEQLLSYVSDLQYILSSLKDNDSFFKEDQGYYIYTNQVSLQKWANKRYLVNDYHTTCGTLFALLQEEVSPGEIDDMIDESQAEYEVTEVNDQLYLVKKNWYGLYRNSLRC